MELYDKKYVYFEWNDELDGKKGFVADDICELTNCILGGNFHHTKVRKSLNPAFPFKDTNNNDWLFFYYDPNYEVKKAYNEGKKLQWKYRHEEKWKDKEKLMEDKISVKNYLEYLYEKYPEEFSSNWNIYFAYMKAEEESIFFISLIRKIIESSSEISDEDKLYVLRYFDILVDEYWSKLQEQKHPTKPKYSAEQAFNVIRTMNCSLEDKLKVAELFEYMEK